MESIRNDQLVIPSGADDRQVNPELMNVLLAMLNKDPAQRITLP